MRIERRSRLKQCDAAVVVALYGDSDAIGPRGRLSGLDGLSAIPQFLVAGCLQVEMVIDVLTRDEQHVTRPPLDVTYPQKVRTRRRGAKQYHSIADRSPRR